MNSHSQVSVSPKVKPRDFSGSSALIDRPNRLARPPARLAGSTTPTPTSRSWWAPVRTSTNASAGVSCIVSGVAESSPRTIGSNTVRARPMPSSSSSLGWGTATSPICRPRSPAAQTAAAGTRRLGSASACSPKRSSHSSSPSAGVNSSRQVRAGSTLPATPSRQWWVAMLRRSSSSSPRLRLPSPLPRAFCQAASKGSSPPALALKPTRSWPSRRASSRLATRRRPLPGRRQAREGSPLGPAARAQVATWGRPLARSSRRRRSSSRLSRGSQRALPSAIWGSQRPRAIRLRAQRCR